MTGREEALEVRSEIKLVQIVLKTLGNFKRSSFILNFISVFILKEQFTYTLRVNDHSLSIDDRIEAKKQILEIYYDISIMEMMRNAFYF